MRGLLLVKSHGSLITRFLGDHVTNWNHYTSNNTIPMATGLGRMVPHLKRLPPVKLLKPLVTWSCLITWQTKHIIYLLLQYLKATKLGEVVTYYEELPPKKITSSINHLNLWGHVTYKIIYIFICIRPIATKHGKVVTHHEGLPPINSHNPWNMCSREDTWPIKTIIYLLSQCLWSLDY